MFFSSIKPKEYNEMQNTESMREKTFSDFAIPGSVLKLYYELIIIFTRPKPPYGRQGLAGLWGKDTVRQVHFGVFSASRFTPLAVSSDWILLIEARLVES